jgi:hypothetical protein
VEISPSFVMTLVGKLVVDGSSRLGSGYFFSWLSYWLALKCERKTEIAET